MVFDLALFEALHRAVHLSVAFDAAIIFFGHYAPYLAVFFALPLLVLRVKPVSRGVSVFMSSLAAGVIARLGVVEIIRWFVHRPRPFELFFFDPLISAQGFSFPSGHAAFFFAFAVVLAYYDRRLGRWFLGLATVVSLARVLAGVHYPLDVLVGALVGAVVAAVLVPFLKFSSRTV